MFISRHGASLQVSTKAACNSQIGGGPENLFFLLLADAGRDLVDYYMYVVDIVHVLVFEYSTVRTLPTEAHSTHDWLDPHCTFDTDATCTLVSRSADDE
eukprot:COSAG02_NODE_33559_length_498_cov_0.781955_1_plen_99_part_00